MNGDNQPPDYPQQPSNMPPPPPPPQQYPQGQQYPQQPQQTQQPYPQYPQGQPYPQYYPPPKKKHTGLIIGIVTAVVAVVIILAVILIANPFAPPIVGKWHITEIKVSSAFGDYTDKADMYIEFHSDGTGKSYGGGSYSVYNDFKWKDLGNNKVKIMSTTDESDYIILHYQINGNHIELSYSAYGATVTFYGQRA